MPTKMIIRILDAGKEIWEWYKKQAPTASPEVIKAAVGNWHGSVERKDHTPDASIGTQNTFLADVAISKKKQLTMAIDGYDSSGKKITESITLVCQVIEEKNARRTSEWLLVGCYMGRRLHESKAAHFGAFRLKYDRNELSWKGEYFSSRGSMGTMSMHRAKVDEP